MKKMNLVLFCTAMLLQTRATATIIRVPADRTTVQGGVDAASNGDTVVVYPGTYVENVIFRGKRIVLTSRFYENGDFNFVRTTIIDGSRPARADSASCVLMINGEDSAAVLQGFTLTGGKGTAWTDEHGAGIYREGGGILIAASSPTVRFNLIAGNEIVNTNGVTSTGGGGIRAGDGNPRILNNVIVSNAARYGAGIVLNYTGATVKNNIVYGNAGGQDYGGGAIWMNHDGPAGKIIENNTIVFNPAGGGGIYTWAGSSDVRNSIVWGNTSSSAPQIGIRTGGSAVTYCDIQGGWTGAGNINSDPQFDDSSFVLKTESPCVDGGDTAAAFTDPPDPSDGSLAAYPSRGSRRNDMGAYGGNGRQNFFPFAEAVLSLPVAEAFFGYRLPGDSSAADFVFANSGSKTLRIDSVVFPRSSFFATGSFPFTVGINRTRKLPVQWKPALQINYSDTGLVYHNSPSAINPCRIAAKGNAIPTAHTEVDCADHNFGSVDINVSSKDTTVYVYNRGTAEDSVTVSVDAGDVDPPSAVAATPTHFIVQAKDSQAVTFAIFPRQIIKTAGGNYAPKLRLKPWLGDDTATVEKTVRFRITGTPAADSMKYIGHSFVKIKTSDGTVIYIDPYGVNEYADSADIVLITHEHSDHNDLTRVRQRATCRVIRSADAIQGGVYQTFTIGNIKITAVPAYNGYHAKSACVGYIVEFNGIKLYHAGDTGKIPEFADLADHNILYALLPMDGVYTMTPEEATEAAAMIQAKHDIPIHTMPPPDTYSDAIVARFTSPNTLVVHPDSTIALESNPVSVDKKVTLPIKYALEQNYPNPFNPSTTVRYSIPKKSFVSLRVVDVLGREMESLVREYQNPGEFRARFNARRLSSGVYFLVLQAGDFRGVKKCVLVR
jgi:L-ascorbate metabolism protein UlaG (beta-lactamase superfamily)